jgi:hypothetical protein
VQPRSLPDRRGKSLADRKGQPQDTDAEMLPMTEQAAGADYRNRAIGDNLVEFLQLLGRAARQFRTYPATSPLCTDAIGACHQAFMALDLDRPLAFRIARHEVLLDDDAIGRDTIIEHEICQPLYRARVSSVEIDRTVSFRDWARFCALLAAAVRRAHGSPGLPELLLDAGVGAIVLGVTPEPELFDIGTPAQAVGDLVERERERQAAATVVSPSQHLYPPDKGWVRFDPAVGFESISLLDLTVLVNDPAELAAMLTRLVDDEPIDAAGRAAALEQRYSDIVLLIGALDPRLGRMLFSKLARGVLDLDPERRRSLLRRAILPNLLDGRVDGEAVLGEFPDVDLAQALCLLLDLETAAPQMLAVALDRLHLPPDRRKTVVPLIEAGVADASPDRALQDSATADLERRAGALTRIDPAAGKAFDEFTAFDLSMDDAVTAALSQARQEILAVDDVDALLACVSRLVTVEPNPAIADAVLARGTSAFQTLVRGKRWDEARRWFTEFAALATTLQPTRSDVASVVSDAIGRLCDRDLVLHLAALCSTPAGRTTATAIVAAVGQSIVPAWLDALEAAGDRARVRGLTPAVSESARLLAPAIVQRLPSLGTEAARVAVAVLGFADAGYETAIAAVASSRDERTSREAFRALARIGSAKAAALILEQLEEGPAAIQAAAEEALWHLPPALVVSRAGELLGRRRFVTRHPQVAVRLIEKAAHDAAGLAPVLQSLIPLRFHFWSPAVARVGARARALLQ